MKWPISVSFRFFLAISGDQKCFWKAAQRCELDLLPSFDVVLNSLSVFVSVTSCYAAVIATSLGAESG